MLTYYCPRCWNSVSGHVSVCPTCGAAIEDDEADIVEKYIAALHHPESATRLRAAWILGRMRQARAVPALVQLVMARQGNDPYLTSVAAKSLGLIGSREALPCLTELLADPNASFMARIQAAHALERIGGDQALAALAEATHTASESVRAAARDALAAGTASADGVGG
jgi:HEAT repeat protein